MEINPVDNVEEIARHADLFRAKEVVLQKPFAPADLGEIIRDDHFGGESWALEVLNDDRRIVLTLRFNAEGRRLDDVGR